MRYASFAPLKLGVGQEIEMMGTIGIIKSVGYFILAGLFEIGGGYLVWLWLREGKPIGYAFVGAIILVLYGIIPTFQPAHFGRVYAAYGGVFIVLPIDRKSTRLNPSHTNIYRRPSSA